MRATVAALVEGVWLRDFQEEVTRDVEFKGLQAEPDGGFALIKTMNERYKIIWEERSRLKKGRSNK